MLIVGKLPKLFFNVIFMVKNLFQHQVFLNPDKIGDYFSAVVNAEDRQLDKIIARLKKENQDTRQQLIDKVREIRDQSAKINSPYHQSQVLKYTDFLKKIDGDLEVLASRYQRKKTDVVRNAQKEEKKLSHEVDTQTRK